MKPLPSHEATFLAFCRRLIALMLLSPILPLSAQNLAPGSAQANCPPQATVPTAQQLQSARDRARDRGVLWRITRDGRTSWLYGTLHLGKLEWAVPGVKLRQALLEVDALALELDISDPATLAKLQAVQSPTPVELQARLLKQVVAACLPPESLTALHPVLQVMALGGMDARWVGLDPGFGIEHVLTGFARARKLPVIALETPEIQLQALIPAETSEMARLVDQSLAQLESGLTRRVIGRLAQAWAEGDLETVARYEDWCECISTADDRAAVRRINDDRNPYLSERIEHLHAQGQRLFAAVGLLHMTGPQSLTTLLAQRGFTVERVSLQ